MNIFISRNIKKFFIIKNINVVRIIYVIYDTFFIYTMYLLILSAYKYILDIFLQFPAPRMSYCTRSFTYLFLGYFLECSKIVYNFIIIPFCIISFSQLGSETL